MTIKFFTVQYKSTLMSHFSVLKYALEIMNLSFAYNLTFDTILFILPWGYRHMLLRGEFYNG